MPSYIHRSQICIQIMISEYFTCCFVYFNTLNKNLHPTFFASHSHSHSHSHGHSRSLIHCHGHSHCCSHNYFSYALLSICEHGFRPEIQQHFFINYHIYIYNIYTSICIYLNNNVLITTCKQHLPPPQELCRCNACAYTFCSYNIYNSMPHQTCCLSSVCQLQIPTRRVSK